MNKLLLWEIRKQIIINALLVIIVAAFVAGLLVWRIRQNRTLPYSKDVYHSYMSQLTGELDDEKVEFIHNRLIEIEECIAAYEEYYSKYDNDLIDKSEYKEYIKKYEIAAAEYETVAYIVQKIDYLNEVKSFKTYLFYDTEWMELFTRGGGQYYVLIVAAVLISSLCFAREYASNSVANLKTSKYGTYKIALCKIVICSAGVMLLSVLMNGVGLLLYMKPGNVKHMNEAIGNVLLTENYSDASIIKVYLLDSVLKSCAIGSCAAITCVVAVTIRNLLYTIPISVSILAAIKYLGKLSLFGRTIVDFSGIYPNQAWYIWTLVAVIAVLLICNLCTTILWNRAGK